MQMEKNESERSHPTHRPGQRRPLGGIRVSKTIEYERMIDEEEQSLVHKATEIEMTELKTGKNKTYTFREIKESISSQK